MEERVDNFLLGDNSNLDVWHEHTSGVPGEINAGDVDFVNIVDNADLAVVPGSPAIQGLVKIVNAVLELLLIPSYHDEMLSTAMAIDPSLAAQHSEEPSMPDGIIVPSSQTIPHATIAEDRHDPKIVQPLTSTGEQDTTGVSW